MPAPTTLHVITGLNTGGAEAMLAKLVGHCELKRNGTRHEVLSLLPAGPVADRIRDADVPVHTLGMQRGAPGPVHVARLVATVRRLKPCLIQGWMYHGNLAATVACSLSRGSPGLIWNIRHSVADLARETRKTQRVIRLGARLSARPAAIIYNSRTAAEQHHRLGYLEDRTTIIDNGFDCSQFAPDPNAHALLRRLFGIRGEPTIVAMVARAHPMKSVDILIEAVGRARAEGLDLHLLLVGAGMDQLAPAAAQLLAGSIPPDRVTLSGERNDVAKWLPGVDILALSSSWGEGFPNILGEAMACGIPCVTTDVGDARMVVDHTGLVVPPGDAGALALAIGRIDRLGSAGRQMLGRAARARAITHFSLDRVARAYADLYERHMPTGGSADTDPEADVRLLRTRP
jgi:glycosyltransferase involved in cell wall biosynthesis